MFETVLPYCQYFVSFVDLLQAPSGELTDGIILKVSLNISDKLVIKRLGTELGLGMDTIENCINSYGPNNKEIAHHVLREWDKDQWRRRKAFVTLWNTLFKTNLGKVAYNVMKPSLPSANMDDDDNVTRNGCWPK